MPAIVFHLKDAPEDEADDVRALLDRAGIDWYETRGGNVALAFGLAVPAIWVRDDADKPRARELIDAYQRERVARVRAERGEPARIRPLAALLAILLAGVVVYFSVSPFLF